MLARTLCVSFLLACVTVPDARADLVWTAPTPPVSTKEANASSPVTGVDAEGGAVVAWRETDAGKYRIHVATRTRRGFLGPSQILSPAGVDAGAPKLAVARDGSAVVGWTQDRPGAEPNGIYTAVRKPGQPFGDVEKETSNPDAEALRALAVNRQGRTILISTLNAPKGEILHSRTREPTGSGTDTNFTGTSVLWNGSDLNPDPTARGLVYSVKIAFDADGDAAIGWGDAKSAKNTDAVPTEVWVAGINANGSTAFRQLVAERTQNTVESVGFAGVIISPTRTVATWVRASGGTAHRAELAFRTGLGGGAFTAPQVVGGSEDTTWGAVTPDGAGNGLAGFTREYADPTPDRHEEIYFPAGQADFRGSIDLPTGFTDTPTAFDDAGLGSFLSRKDGRLRFTQRGPGAGGPVYSTPVDLGPDADLELPDFSSDDQLAIGPDGTAAVAYTVLQGLNEQVVTRFGDVPLPPPPPGVTPTPTPAPTPPPQPEPPVPSAIQVAGKVGPGEAAVLTVDVTGAANSIEWSTGSGRSSFGYATGGVLPRSLRTHLRGPTTVTVKVSGPGGLKTFSRSLTGPKDATDDKGRTISRGSPPSKAPVTATGTEAVLTGKSSACGNVLVFSGKLTLSGCMKPILGLSDIPAGERGVLGVLSTAYGLDNDYGLLSRAAELVDGFVISGPARINGLWPVTPAPGAALVAYPPAAALTSSSAAVRVGGANLKPSGSGFNLRLDSDTGITDLGDVPVPGLRMGGFGLTGGFDVQLGPTEATIHTNVKMPPFVQRYGVTLTPGITIKASPEELSQGIPPTIAPPDVSFGPVKINGLGLTYDKLSDAWAGGGAACFFGATCLDFRPPAGRLLMKGDALAYARTALAFGSPGVPLAPGVFLERINAGLAVDPSRAFGSGRISVGSFLKLDGSEVFAFPSGAAPYTLQRGEVGNGFPANFYANQYTRPLIAAGADVSLALPVLGETKFANGYMLYEVPGYIAVGGGIGADILGLFKLSGNMDGEYNLANQRSNLHGDIRACLTAVDDDLCAVSITNISRGPNLEGGAGACTRIGPVNVGAGVQWARPGKPFIWPIDGCKWSPFKLDVRTRADGPITTVTVEVGKDAKAVRLDGAGESPQVRVTGPQTLEPEGKRLAYTADGQVRIVRADVADQHFTTVGLQAPGTWKIEVLPGSAAITTSSQAENPPAAKVSGRVTRGKGDRRVLTYDVLARVTQKVSFFDVSPGGGRKLIGTTAGGRGKLTFSPAPDTRRHAVVAAFALDELPAEEKPVTTFQPPPPTLPVPRAVTVRRKDTRVTVRWRGVRGATRYELALNAGKQRFVTTPKRTATFKGVARGSGGTVTVRAVATLRQSGVARKGFRRVTKGKQKLRGLKRCTVRRKRVKCH